MLAAPYEPLRDGQWAAIVTLVDADRPRGGKLDGDPGVLRGVDDLLAVVQALAG